MMQKLSVNLENCFGIGKLNHEFDFSKSNSSLIYAPNGTMKTSFARTFDLLSKNDPKNIPRDRVYKIVLCTRQISQNPYPIRLLLS